MNNRTGQLEIFFTKYAERTNNALHNQPWDVEETAGAFAEYFVESSPLGIIGGKNDEEFRERIPKGFDFYKQAGITSMDIVSKQITLLDDFHSMVKVQWRTSFTRKDQSKGSIEFEVIYLVWSMDGVHKIFAYITGDEQKALRVHGLI